MTKFTKSVEHLQKAELTIPLGSQTFSKSRAQYPVGISPLYAEKAKGAVIWDVDGNKFIDLVSSLASVTLGYRDNEVNQAVKKQLLKGTSFSLPARLESEVAELIVSMVPSADMVRFGKNGSDATSAAIRLARAFTGRDHIVVCGYHGWHDWYIGSTSRDKGVPDSVSKLTHKFEYNNAESLEYILSLIGNKVAAVIMEPMNSIYPVEGFLETVRDLTHQVGALLIFDETITGFRFSEGGAQELFNVTPDISTFGKGIANGFPLSAIVGRRDVMTGMEEIFFSTTFGGELLSLTAAKIVLQRHQSGKVCQHLSELGTSLATKTEELVSSNNLQKILSISGHPTWKFLNWTSTEDFSVDEIKTYFMQEVFKRKLLVLSSHNISLAHNSKVISKISETYAEVFYNLGHAINQGTLRNELKVSPISPLFKVR